MNLSMETHNRSGTISISTNHTKVVPEPPMYILSMVGLFYTIIFLSGVIGNILVIFVVLRNKDMRNPTNYFLVNLSVADLMVLIVCMPSAFVDLYAKEVWYFGSAMCESGISGVVIGVWYINLYQVAVCLVES